MTAARHLARGCGAAALLALCACAALRGAPETSSGSRPGTTRYAVGALSFELPSAWQASGDRRSVKAVHPAEQARVEVRAVDQRYASEKACLEAGSAVLARGDRTFSNVRRSPSRFAGRPAVAQEADQGGWHGWAWAVCDGGAQYRVFFTARAPVTGEVVETWRAFTRSAAIARGREGP